MSGLGLLTDIWVPGTLGTSERYITRFVNLRTGTRRNKGEYEKLTDEELDDHARDDRLPKLLQP